MASLPLARSTFRPGVLTASALKVGQREDGRLADFERRQGLPWQFDALRFYRSIGEVRYASHFYSRMMKRLRIYPAFKRPDGGRPEAITEGPPAELLERIQDPGGGRSKILGDYGRLMFITGECYLFGRDLNTDDEKWSVVWRGELDFQDGEIIIWRPASQIEYAYGPGDAIAYRMWTPHPERSYEADSPMQSVIDICDELSILSRSVRATAVSRIANNGILFMPLEISPPPIEPGTDEDPLSDPFMADWIEHMNSSMQEAGTAEAAAPLLSWASAEYIDKVRHIKMREAADDYAERDLRTEAIKRLALGFDMPPEELLGMANANHWCQTSDTKILTSDGWRYHDEIGVGTEVLTLNHETGMSEWQEVQHVARFDVVDLPMVSVRNRYHSSLSTMNHRWPVMEMRGRQRSWERVWLHAEELNTRHRFITGAVCGDVPQEPLHDDAFVETMAWLWTEGQIRERGDGRPPQVAIYQSHVANQENVTRIRVALTALYGSAVPSMRTGGMMPTEPKWREEQREGKTVFWLNARAAETLLEHIDSRRCVSLDFIRSLTKAQLELFIATSIRGDGSVMKNGTPIIGQAKSERLAAFELAVILSGRTPASHSHRHRGFTDHLQHYVTVSERSTVAIKSPKQISTERYTGIVWCPVTPNSTWLASRDGHVFYTGNTAWQIKDETWQSHGAPIAEQFCDDLNEAYLRPALRDEGFDRWRDVVIRYDAAEVVVNPDRSDDANEAWDRGAIGYGAYRRMKNIPEQDAMPDDEREQWLALKLRNPALLGVPEQRVRQPEPVADGVPDDGPDAVRERTGRAASVIARELGAADLALLRCRELAGIRLRQKARACPDCLAAANGSPNALVASRVGSDNLERLGFSDVRELVSGGADGLRSLLVEWGYADAQAAAFAEMIEVYASRTVFQPAQPALPASFAAHLERIKEVSVGS